MNKTHRQLHTLDPVRLSELEAVSSHPVFDELFEEIVSSPRASVASLLGGPDEADLAGHHDVDTGQPEPIEFGRRQQGGHRRLLVTAIAAIAAMFLLVGGLALQSPGRPADSGSTRATTGPKLATGPVPAPRWRLVSDVDSSWRTVSALGSDAGVSLTCPSATTCYAVDLQPQQSALGTYDQIEVTHDGGDTWQQFNLPVMLSGATGFACVDAATCATLGIDPSGNAMFLETTDGGNTWATVAGPSQLTSSIDITALACTGAEACIAVSSDPSGQSGAALSFVTDDGGATWTDSNLPTDFVPSGQRGIQCLSAQDCVVSGFYQSPDGSSENPPGTVLYTTDDGTTWTTATLPPELGPLGSLSCADTTDCVASFFGYDGSSSEILVSTDGGQSWSEADATGLPAAFVTGVSCPTTSDCWAGGLDRASGGSTGSGPIAVKLGPGAEGVVASTADGGQTWQSAQLPEGVLAVLDVACPSDTTCYALAIQNPSSGSQASFVLLAYGS